MKYALIGCGKIAPTHLKAAIENGLEIVAVCDMAKSRAEEILKNVGVDADKTAVYTDYKKMIDENPDLELISVATISGTHAEIALYCIDKGINVIIEKPIALSIEDADKIVALGKERNVKVSACQQNRFNVAVRQMRKALESGRFGKISHGSISVRWTRDKNYYGQAKWRGTWKEDGGALMNQCIHGIDLLRWMMGDEIEEVYGVTRRQFHDYIECEDLGMAVVKFKNGAVGTIEGTTNVFPDNLEETLCLFGQTGTVKISGTSVNAIKVWEFADKNSADEDKEGFTEKTENVYGNGHADLFADVIDAIKNDRQPYVDAVAGRNALELVLAVYKSAAEGKPVKLPLKNCATTDFKGRF